MKRLVVAVVAPVVAAVGVVLLAATAVSAHVEVDLGQLAPDHSAHITFHVPNEEPGAGTARIEIVFPEAPLVPRAMPAPVAGWTASVAPRPLPQSGSGAVGAAVASVTYVGGPLTGDGATLDLPMTIGPLPPGATSVEFKVLQTYDNGDVVRWIEETPKGGPAPDHPAPLLELAPPATSTTRGAVAAKRSSRGGVEAGLVVVVIVAAAVVLGGGGLLLMRRRSRARAG